MRVTKESVTVTSGNTKKVKTITTTYLKVGDIIGTAKSSYDLGKKLVQNKKTINKTLKQYGVSYVSSLLNPLIVLIKSMDIYKKIMSVVQIVTPIAQTVARASGVWSSPGNVGDIAQILLGVINKILIQLATIFLIKMKDIIWNFEFKVKSVPETATYLITKAIYDISSGSYKIVNSDINGIDTDISNGGRKYGVGDTENNTTEQEAVPDTDKPGQTTGGNDTTEQEDSKISIDDFIIKADKYNQGLKYKHYIDGVWSDWQDSNYKDGSFRNVVVKNGILFTFSYEGENCDSKPYGILYSEDKGITWNVLNNAYKDFYVFDASFLETASECLLNFSAYGEVAERTGDKIILTDKGAETLREYKLINVLKDYFNDYTVYVREYTNEETEVTEYYNDVYLKNEDIHAVIDSETFNDLVIRAEKFATFNIEIENNKLKKNEYIDALDAEGNIQFDTDKNYISRYLNNSIVFNMFFLNEIKILLDIEYEIHTIGTLDIYNPNDNGVPEKISDDTIRVIKYINNITNVETVSRAGNLTIFNNDTQTEDVSIPVDSTSIKQVTTHTYEIPFVKKLV